MSIEEFIELNTEQLIVTNALLERLLERMPSTPAETAEVTWSADDNTGAPPAYVPSCNVDDTPDPAPAPSYDDARDAILSLVQSHGHDCVVSLLEKLGVKRLNDLPEGRYSDLISACNNAESL